MQNLGHPINSTLYERAYRSTIRLATAGNRSRHTPCAVSARKKYRKPSHFRGEKKSATTTLPRLNHTLAGCSRVAPDDYIARSRLAIVSRYLAQSLRAATWIRIRL